MTLHHVLRTTRLTLRPFEAGDADALFAMRSNPLIMRYGSGVPWTGREQAVRKVAESAAAFARGEAYPFAIVLDATGELAGDCCIFHIHPESRRAELGYTLDSAFWGKGYMHEALCALLEFGFGTLGLNRLEADIHPDNAPSRKVLERLGFEQDGYLRERWIVGGEVSDSALFGLLRREWEAKKPAGGARP